MLTINNWKFVLYYVKYKVQGKMVRKSQSANALNRSRKGAKTRHYYFYLLFRAAFQYGVKMADGRKTRRAGPKDEKAELDRQWQKIQNILKTKTGEPNEKKMKH